MAISLVKEVANRTKITRHGDFQKGHDRSRRFFTFGGLEYGIFDEGGDDEYITCLAGGIMTSSEDEE
ncbi:hypothetical protein V6N11_084453 [Hibiscus sabdariffa]|uniref:Uncharacterized protein n=2 Tax=Hibiscus sabdariffa TaxID=183260 RepID=A0ABR1ZFB3_9ROSI